MKYCFFRIIVLFLVFSVSTVKAQQPTEKSESIYPKRYTEKTGFYDFLWGKHYRELYTLEISAPDTNDTITQKLIPIAEDYPYFRYFPEFEKFYQKEKFEGTYANRFVIDAYTLIHPLSSVITNGLAKNIGLHSKNNPLFYKNGKLHKSAKKDNSLITTSEVISRLEENFVYKIDEKLYVRSRLLDMITGNSLSVNDSYLWKKSDGNEETYYPYVVDRGFSFAKKDGLLYGALLNSMGLKNIPNYYKKKLKTDKINSHNYVTDFALSNRIKEQVWIEESTFIKAKLTEEVINGIFAELPENFQQTQSNQKLKKALIHRIMNIEVLAKEYYESLQKTAIVRGTAQDDTFEIFQNHSATTVTVKNLRGETVFANEYLVGRTQEIWIYGFGGIDTFSVSESDKNNIVIRIINNDIYNEYNLKQASNNIKVYTTKEAIVTDDETGNASLFKTDNPNILEYSDDRPKKHTLTFQPGILLDTDLALRLGGKFTYTRYAFKNQPFSARHELSWNHHYSLLYSGTFPTLNEKLIYTGDVWLTSKNHFQNFFGFGNESENYESSFGRGYNRVLLQRFGADAGIIFNFSENQKATVKAGVERFNIIDEQKFHRDDIFQEGELTDKTNFFLNLKGTYQISSEQTEESLFSYVLVPEAGLIMNFRDMNRNVPYLAGMISFKFNPDFDRKYTVASNLKAKALFNETYEFYQAATMGGETGLRGYRNERFSGQQYFVHSTDFRINIGKLTNKVVPLNFEPFLGVDYGRVWYADENSRKWHTSFGGGFSFKVINKFDANISYFTSSERPRITLSMGYFF